MPLAPEQRAALLRRVAGDVGTVADSVRAKMLRLHEALPAATSIPTIRGLATIRQRLELAYAASDAIRPPPLTHDALGRDRLVTAPPLTRTSMVPHAWPRGLLARWFLRFVRHDDAARERRAANRATPAPIRFNARRNIANDGVAPRRSGASS